jgi:hypothetical protein
MVVQVSCRLGKETIDRILMDRSFSNLKVLFLVIGKGKTLQNNYPSHNQRQKDQIVNNMSRIN